MFERKLKVTILVMLLLLFTELIGKTSVVSAAPVNGEGIAINNPAVFSDVSVQGSLYPYVRFLSEKDIVSGYPDGTFRPSESITRAELAVIVTKVKGLSPIAGGDPTFRDVSSSHWAFGFIEAAVHSGLFRGYPDGYFFPDQVVTRAEAVTMLLKLAGGTLAETNQTMEDVSSDHWAYPSIATAIEAALVDLPPDRSFQPNAIFRRGDLARGLGVLFTIGPDLRSVDLAGILSVKKGKVNVIMGNGSLQEVTDPMKVGAGAKITTSPGSQAEFVFDDGSGMIIEENTEIEITQSKGLTYIHKNGASGVMIDKFVVTLTKGKIFGALATRYEKSQGADSGSKIGLKGAIKLASIQLPGDLGDALLADNSVPWWQEPYSERERVVVDMPWGVAGIRGTIWANQVTGTSQSTSLITGSAVVTSGGQTVSVTAGQSTSISSPSAPPAPPAPMSPNESQAWAQVTTWVQERAREIQNNIPVPPAPVILAPDLPVDPPQNLQPQEDETVINHVNDALNRVTDNANADNITRNNPTNHSSHRHTSDAPAESNITVINNVQNYDIVTVTNVPDNAEVKVYDAEEDGNKIGEAINDGISNLVIIEIDQLSVDAGSVFVTITEPGKRESARIKKIYEAEPNPEDPNAVVYFEDEVLEGLVRGALNKVEGDIITRADMAVLNSLSAIGSEVKVVHLTGLEYATNLRSLDLENNNIVDISPLEGLVNLEVLDLSDNQIADISPLGGLTNLIELNLEYNDLDLLDLATSKTIEDIRNNNNENMVLLYEEQNMAK